MRVTRREGSRCEGPAADFVQVPSSKKCNPRSGESVHRAKGDCQVAGQLERLETTRPGLGRDHRPLIRRGRHLSLLAAPGLLQNSPIRPASQLRSNFELAGRVRSFGCPDCPRGSPGRLSGGRLLGIPIKLSAGVFDGCAGVPEAFTRTLSPASNSRPKFSVFIQGQEWRVY